MNTKAKLILLVGLLLIAAQLAPAVGQPYMTCFRPLCMAVRVDAPIEPYWERSLAKVYLQCANGIWLYEFPEYFHPDYAEWYTPITFLDGQLPCTIVQAYIQLSNGLQAQVAHAVGRTWPPSLFLPYVKK